MWQILLDFYKDAKSSGAIVGSSPGLFVFLYRAYSALTVVMGVITWPFSTVKLTSPLKG